MSALLVALVEHIPNGLLPFVARALAFVLFDLLGYRRAVLRENLSRAFPEASEAERRALARGVALSLSRTLLLHLQLGARAEQGRLSEVEIRGLDLLRARLAEGKGVLVLTGHLGAFELAAAAVAAAIRPRRLHLVVKRLPKWLDRTFLRIRTRAGLGVISGEGAFFQIVDALRAGDLVVFVIDQNATAKQGLFVDFFGRSACTYTAPSLILDRTGAAAVGATVWREPGGRDVIELGPNFPDLSGEPRKTRPRTRLGLFTRTLEDSIRAHPHDWIWTHRRWKTRPPEDS